MANFNDLTIQALTYYVSNEAKSTGLIVFHNQEGDAYLAPSPSGDFLTKDQIAKFLKDHPEILIPNDLSAGLEGRGINVLPKSGQTSVLQAGESQADQEELISITTEGGKTFQIPKESLELQSEYFKGMLRSGMIETEGKSIPLKALKGIPEEITNSFLECLENFPGTNIITEENVAPLFDLSCTLLVNWLQKDCLDFFSQHIAEADTDGILEVLEKNALSNMSVELTHMCVDRLYALKSSLTEDELAKIKKIGEENKLPVLKLLGKQREDCTIKWSQNQGLCITMQTSDPSIFEEDLKEVSKWYSPKIQMKYAFLSAQGAKTLAEALKENQSVTSLDLEGSKIKADGAKALAEALKKSKSLTSLNLWDNQIGADGAKALRVALEENQSLTSLVLTGNKIGANGAKELAEALKKNKSLTSLSLLGNQIGDEGAKALAEGLIENQSLTSLDLWGNEIGAKGGTALVETLKENKFLTSLDLGNNQIGAKNIEALAEALKRNKYSFATQTAHTIAK